MTFHVLGYSRSAHVSRMQNLPGETGSRLLNTYFPHCVPIHTVDISESGERGSRMLSRGREEGREEGTEEAGTLMIAMILLESTVKHSRMSGQWVMHCTTVT